MSINSDYSNYNTNIRDLSSFVALEMKLVTLDSKIATARAFRREDQVASLEKEKGTLIKDYGLDKYLSELDYRISVTKKQKDMAEASLKDPTTSPEKRQDLQSFLIAADNIIKMVSKEKEEAIRLVGLVTPVEQPSANSETSSAQTQESTSSTKSSARRLRNSGMRI